MSKDNRMTVKEKRKQLGLTQEEVAKLSDIPYSSYTKKERGDRRWLFDEIYSICDKAFHCSTSEIKS